MGTLAVIAVAAVSYAIYANTRPVTTETRIIHIDGNVRRLRKIIEAQVRKGRALDVSELEGLLVDEIGSPIVIEVHDREFVIRSVVERPGFGPLRVHR
jgi:hypothetical protein